MGVNMLWDTITVVTKTLNSLSTAYTKYRTARYIYELYPSPTTRR